MQYNVPTQVQGLAAFEVIAGALFRWPACENSYNDNFPLLGIDTQFLSYTFPGRGILKNAAFIDAGAGGKHHSVVVTSTGDSYSFGSNKEVHAFPLSCVLLLAILLGRMLTNLRRILFQGQCGTGSVKSTPKSEGPPFCTHAINHSLSSICLNNRSLQIGSILQTGKGVHGCQGGYCTGVLRPCNIWSACPGSPNANRRRADQTLPCPCGQSCCCRRQRRW